MRLYLNAAPRVSRANQVRYGTRWLSCAAVSAASLILLSAMREARPSEWSYVTE